MSYVNDPVGSDSTASSHSEPGPACPAAKKQSHCVAWQLPPTTGSPGWERWDLILEASSILKSEEASWMRGEMSSGNWNKSNCLNIALKITMTWMTENLHQQLNLGTFDLLVMLDRITKVSRIYRFGQWMSDWPVFTHWKSLNICILKCVQ